MPSSEQDANNGRDRWKATFVISFGWQLHKYSKKKKVRESTSKDSKKKGETKKIPHFSLVETIAFIGSNQFVRSIWNRFFKECDFMLACGRCLNISDQGVHPPSTLQEQRIFCFLLFAGVCACSLLWDIWE